MRVDQTNSNGDANEPHAVGVVEEQRSWAFPQVEGSQRIACASELSTCGEGLDLVGPCAHHRRASLCDANDARRQRDGLSRQPVRIAGAVPVLMMGMHPRHQVMEIRAHLKNMRSEFRMLPDELPFLGGQRPGLLQQQIGQRDLADVVQQGGGGDCKDPVLLHPQFPGDRRGQITHLVGVGTDPLIADLQQLH